MNIPVCPDLLGGQNIHPIIHQVINQAQGKHQTTSGLDYEWFNVWLDQTHEYITGKKDRETAINDFLIQAKDRERMYRDKYEEFGITALLP